MCLNRSPKPRADKIDITVLAFDVFGTVVDWRGGVIAELDRLADERGLSINSGVVADAWRKGARVVLDRVARGETPYTVLDDVHRSVLDGFAEEFSLTDLSESDRQRLVSTWHRLPAWPDAVEGLTRLRSQYILTTLSNGGMAHQVDVARFAHLHFDCILSTELVKTYKPNPRVYELVPSLLRVRPEEAMMVASHPYDLAAAASQGFRTAFVRRPKEWGTGKSEEPNFPVDIAAHDFIDLARKLDSQ
ncbi:MAG TPA: haloacid dehalogenase type II [Candidatus Dormibacteraeota bacterium]|nr:haloacid dehalogenase type II [Candidatus Dormibacteraeota bacterium]